MASSNLVQSVNRCPESVPSLSTSTICRDPDPCDANRCWPYPSEPSKRHVRRHPIYYKCVRTAVQPSHVQIHPHIPKGTTFAAIASSLCRLSKLSSTITMGGGPDPKPEHLLVVIPFPEPTAIFERIKKNHPNISITYRSSANPYEVWDKRETAPPEVFKDATILMTVSALPKSREDCPKLGRWCFESCVCWEWVALKLALPDIEGNWSW